MEALTLNKRKSSAFNPKSYGRDERHARSGPEYTSPGDGYAPNRGYVGEGYELSLFRGQYLDKLSIQEILDNEAAEQAVREDISDRTFLAQMGFISDGTTLL